MPEEASIGGISSQKIEKLSVAVEFMRALWLGKTKMIPTKVLGGSFHNLCL